MNWKIGMTQIGSEWELFITNGEDRYIVLQRSPSKYVIQRALNACTIEGQDLPRGIQIGNHNTMHNTF